MTYTKLTTDDIDRAVELIDKKEFLILERTNVALCVMRLKDGSVVVDGDIEHTESSDLGMRYQSAYESALKRIVKHYLPLFHDHPYKTAD